MPPAWLCCSRTTACAVRGAACMRHPPAPRPQRSRDCHAMAIRPSAAAEAGQSAVVQRVVEQFDRRAPSYDQDNTYHPPLAARLVQLAQPQAGEAVLDLGTGTGLVALLAAAAVGPQGRVVGVDCSRGMLQQAQAKQQQPGAAAVEWVLGDMEQLSFLPPGSFDVVTCSSALPFVSDVPGALAAWRRLLRAPGGRLAFNSFAAPAVLDFATFCQVVNRHGLQASDPCEPVGSEQALRALLQGAGFAADRVAVTCEDKERWYPAESPAAYAEGIFDMSARNPFCPITAEAVGGQAALAALRGEVVDAIEQRVAAEGRWEAGRGVRSPYTVLHVLASL